MKPRDFFNNLAAALVPLFWPRVDLIKLFVVNSPSLYVSWTILLMQTTLSSCIWSIWLKNSDWMHAKVLRDRLQKCFCEWHTTPVLSFTFGINVFKEKHNLLGKFSWSFSWTRLNISSVNGIWNGLSFEQRCLSLLPKIILNRQHLVLFLFYVGPINYKIIFF